MIELVDLRSATTVMREFHIGVRSDAHDLDNLEYRLVETLRALNAHQLAEARIDPASRSWMGELPWHGEDGMSDARWSWEVLPGLLVLSAPGDAFSSYLKAPEFITTLIRHHGRAMQEAAAVWESRLIEAIEACLVAIQPDLHFRTAEADLPPRTPRPSEWGYLD